MSVPGRAAEFEVEAGHPDDRAVRAAAKALGAGELVILPTETVYGLAARPDRPEATAALFEAKGRPTSLSLPVLAPTVGVAWRLGRVSQGARLLADAFWPGPLTLVLPRTDLTQGWSLGDRTDTIAVRVPDHPLTAALLERTGPLAATSANPSGRPPLADPGELRAAFEAHVSVFLVLGPGVSPPAGVASTVVDASGSTLSILRRGAVSREELDRALGPDLRIHLDE
jgi:tRNA threonylcarbamoyl adenosine modification protein (Sua5/YciO/YrdC/YwlC family)